jgi:hypothetical protein
LDRVKAPTFDTGRPMAQDLSDRLAEPFRDPGGPERGEVAGCPRPHVRLPRGAAPTRPRHLSAPLSAIAGRMLARSRGAFHKNTQSLCKNSRDPSLEDECALFWKNGLCVLLLLKFSVVSLRISEPSVSEFSFSGSDQEHSSSGSD